MSTFQDKPQRIAFVIAALTGEELKAGKRDVARIYALFTDQKLGKCHPVSSKIVPECQSRHDFETYLSSILESWNSDTQLIFYFSGHGDVLRNKYRLQVGRNKNDFLPFESIINDLEVAGVSRAILILDTCHSGAAIGIKNSNYDSWSVINTDKIPRGIVIIASSQASQKSYELEDDYSSVFTHILCEGIQTGLEGQCTYKGLITVSNIVEYIKKKLENNKQYSVYCQRPIFHMDKADGEIWITINPSGSLTPQNSASKTIDSFKELNTSKTIFIGDADDPTVREYCIAAKQIIEEEFPSKWNVLERHDICTLDSPSAEICGEAASSCDLYIVFIGLFYGSVYEKENLSYTEYELRTAEKCSQRITIFILTNTAINITSDFLNKQSLLMPRQQEFRSYVESKTDVFNVQYISDVDELQEKLKSYLQDLDKEIEQKNPDDIETLISTQNINFLADYTHLNYDRRPVLFYKLKDLDSELITTFLEQPQARTALRRAGLLRARREEHLQILGILHNDKPTLGAFLCFAPQRLLADKFAACGLHLVVYSSTQRAASEASPEFTQDNLLNLFEIGMKFLSSEAGLRRTGRIGTNERDNLEIPEIALREALVNALVHRDYEHSSSKDQPTRIEVYPDRIEITSFGSLPEGVVEAELNQNPENVVPIRRNSIIADVFRIMQRAELNASGIARMHYLTQMATLPRPKIIQGKNSLTVKVIFLRPPKPGPINTDLLIETIPETTQIPLKDKNQRNETVIKLLQQFNLNPEHPPSDFSGVYAYALVEYGVGKLKPLLEIFRHEEVKQAFRKAFDHNNPSILLSEVDTFLDGYSLGDKIRDLGVNVRREVAEFATVFIEVSKHSRSPGDVLMSHQLGSLHKRIASIQEQLSRLPNLEGIRTEIARLAGENYPALPGVSATENNYKAIALAQQMRGWFETLGYRFEKYEVWQDSYFEWIVNIQIWRNRYERFLIRGIAGEAGLADVMALCQSVEQQRTDGGWLITARRVSRAARNEVEKEENRHLGCYTFDELLAQDADFSGYLDWLEAEIKRRKIDTKYVPLACSKEEIDPVSKRSIAVSHYDEQDGWIDGYIDRWLDDPAKEHISILGEFGTGKTWFALHYAWVTLQRYRDAQKRGTELPRLPLVIPLRDYTKAISVESMFAEFFFRQHKIPLPHYDAFVQLNRMGKLLLIFDGFDEMAARVDRQEMINNFWELAKVVVPRAKVILTCRTEHFPEAKEGRALLNAELQASTKDLTGETPQFEVVELEKFDDEQIRQVLSFRSDTGTVEQVMGNPHLLDLVRRPAMAELVLEALPDIEAGKAVDMARVYLYAVRRKMERDIKADRTFTSLADKLYFLCELSWEMLSTNQMSLNYRLFPDRIRQLFGEVVQEEKDLDHWHYDMMAQTMLIRNADGDYTPAHRSLLEFFVAYKFAAELGMLAPDFIELAQVESHLATSGAPQDRTWSSYFRRQVDEEGMIVPVVPLKIFVTEPIETLRNTFGRQPLTKGVLDLLVSMVDLTARQKLNAIIEEIKDKTKQEVGCIADNINIIKEHISIALQPNSDE
jgi:predicted NACHT family NTPase/predicted HTH transcriptional regulator